MVSVVGFHQARHCHTFAILLTVFFPMIVGLFLLQTCLVELHMFCLTTTTMIVMADDIACRICLYTVLQLLRPLLQEEIKGTAVA